MSENPKIAVLIDAENINNLDSIRNLNEQLAQDHSIVVKRAVGDWSRNIRMVKGGMQDLGFELVHQPNHVPHNNLADVRLVIEALELIHDPTNLLDAFAVVSSDQDFLPLYDRLRELGKTVIVAGDKNSNSSRIKKHVDIFIPIAKPAQPEIRYSFMPHARRPTKRRGTKVAKRRMSKNVRNEIGKLLMRSMALSVNDQGVANSAVLYRNMRRLQPGFSVKRLGYARFASLIRSYPQIVSVRGYRRSNARIKLLRRPDCS